MITKLEIEEFLRGQGIFLDVRSPGEYEHAHIPGALSLPLFNNDERKIIGTAYKQESREKAIKIGLDYFGRKMVSLVQEVEELSTKNNTRNIYLHCWRGGMRSSAVAWLLDLYGFKVYLLKGGYKAYRHRVISLFEQPYTLMVLGGYTGSSKTAVLQQLQKEKENVIDLENIAGHRGSALGNLDNIEQPGQEFFENLLASELDRINNSGNKSITWIEAESQRIGNVNIPQAFFATMRSSPLLFLDIPFDARLNQVIEDYGKFNKDKLINAIVRIKKRLGGLETKNAINALLEDDVRTCFMYLLKYYDRLYLKSTLNPADGPRNITYIKSDSTDVKINIQKLKDHVNG